MTQEFSYLVPQKSELSNQQWACLIRDAVSDLNLLLAESLHRDVIVLIEQKQSSMHEHPVLCITHLAEPLL